nr:PP2C family protein-serine/threonine phosphatase [Ornithinibacillus caprae]
MKHYKELLKSYIETQDEKSLYGAEQISKSFIKNNILPEEIVNLHIQSIIELYPDLNKEIRHAMNFLLETMISYGLAHQEYQTLREKQLELKSEISIAANMQETLLATTIPNVEDLDIGVISVPAHQMNGDYHHLVKSNDGLIGIAVADVIGKGIPAALCMSMIKYSMESFPDQSMKPKAILESLNRVVERNVEAGMFITMFYALYNPTDSKLQYASAGHEPGFYYYAEQDTYNEIDAKGLVLGVSPDTNYNQYELQLHQGDMVILLTDGVTECRNNGKFIEREEVIEVIKKYAHLPAQETVNQVYKHFERLQNFQLKDDFTLIILRKNV